MYRIQNELIDVLLELDCRQLVGAAAVDNMLITASMANNLTVEFEIYVGGDTLDHICVSSYVGSHNPIIYMLEEGGGLPADLVQVLKWDIDYARNYPKLTKRRLL